MDTMSVERIEAGTLISLTALTDITIRMSDLD